MELGCFFKYLVGSGFSYNPCNLLQRFQNCGLSVLDDGEGIPAAIYILEIQVFQSLPDIVHFIRGETDVVWV